MMALFGCVTLTDALPAVGTLPCRIVNHFRSRVSGHRPLEPEPCYSPPPRKYPKSPAPFPPLRSLRQSTALSIPSGFWRASGTSLPRICAGCGTGLSDSGSSPARDHEHEHEHEHECVYVYVYVYRRRILGRGQHAAIAGLRPAVTSRNAPTTDRRTSRNRTCQGAPRPDPSA